MGTDALLPLTLRPESVGKAGDLALALNGCSTQEKGLCISPGQHSRLALVEGAMVSPPQGREYGRAGPVTHLA